MQLRDGLFYLLHRLGYAGGRTSRDPLLAEYVIRQQTTQYEYDAKGLHTHTE